MRRRARRSPELPDDGHLAGVAPLSTTNAQLRELGVRHRAGVDLLTRYSNRADLLGPLVSLMAKINEMPDADVETHPLGSADGREPHSRRLADRLTPRDVRGLVAAYREGATIKSLAASYDIGTTSVKRLLREHGARRNQSGHRRMSA